MTTHGSLFAGAGGVDLGFDAAGWSCRWQVEIDPTATSVLQRHWPHAARYSDVCAVDGAELAPVDVISGGFPCQDLSVAGQRAGLNGARSGLFYEFVRIVQEMRHATDGLQPRWVVWENVAGLLSTQHGLADVYAGWDEAGAVVQEHRLVDGRYFGVPQRRRRVIGVVGFDPRTEHGPALLADGEGVRRDPAPSRQEGTPIAALTASGVGAGGGADDNAAQAGHLIPAVNNTLTAHYAKSVNSTADDGLIPVAFNGFNGIDMQPSTTVAPTVRIASGAGMPQVAYPLAVRGRSDGAQLEIGEPNTANALRSGTGGSSRSAAIFAPGMAVRRLTPRECERLMGWPDDHTRYRADDTEIADTHRYRMCGNGVIAPMATWVARRIARVDEAVTA